VSLQVVTNILEKHAATIFRAKWSFHPEDGGIIFLQNTGYHLQDHMMRFLYSGTLQVNTD
jgi:hypothetical protein